ncbi:MAG: class I SAM-dependent methyltransferase [Candidatus Melainabacteria bacterium]
MAGLSALLTEQSLSGGMPYFDYEVTVARGILIPWLTAQGVDIRGKRIGDFGCHQGGVLEALRQAGASGGLGIELNADVVAQSPFHQDAAFRLKAGDILALPEHPTPDQCFDVILLRDVLEHVPDTHSALAVAKRMLAPGGKIFISFPPYYSPFGGHQHEAGDWTRIVPYLHYLPDGLFYALLGGADNVYMNREDALDDIRSVRHTRMTLGKAEAAFARAGLTIAGYTYYLLRPEFKVRYAIPALNAGVLGHVPFLREVWTMGVYYLLEAAA